jgi:hypothetical protein
MLQLDGLWRKKAFQIILILENDFFRVEGEILGINVQVTLNIRGRGKKLIPVFFDGLEVVLLYLSELRDFSQRDVSRLPFLS